MRLLLRLFAVLIIVATVLPIWKHEAWWIRVFDFPRAQIAFFGVLVAGTYMALYRTNHVVEVGFQALLILCVLYQSWMMIPYTFVYPNQVKSVQTDTATNDRLSILIANVLMENREAGRFIELVEEYGPDVVLAVETDAWWADQLAPMDEAYPHSVKVPLPNTYGMLLYSRRPIEGAAVRYLIEDSIPSIHAHVTTTKGRRVQLHCVHPKPPAPTEDTDTINRDAELLVVARDARTTDEPTIVMGDLNDVAWSYTTTLFQKTSGLLDPRVGRGMYTTFHAKNPFMRWPLDHIFHTEDFRLVRIERLPAWGSDHFPMFVELEYSPSAPAEHDAPEPSPDDKQEASEKIEKANDD